MATPKAPGKMQIKTMLRKNIEISLLKLPKKNGHLNEHEARPGSPHPISKIFLPVLEIGRVVP